MLPTPKLRTLLVCTIALLLTASALAQNTIHVPADQPTIQAGINAANTGDIVLVAPGTYYENIDFKGKAITVTSSGGATATIIDGQSKGPAVTFQNSEPRTATLSAFTIQHAGNYNENTLSTFLSAAGGILVSSGSPTILDNVITQNYCWGIESNAAAPLIQGNEISATQDTTGYCSFGGGAGIYIGGNLNNTLGLPNSAIILGNTIQNNVDSGIEDAGGNGGAGIAVWGGSPIIQNNIIRNNASPGGSGGAINVESSGGTTIVQNLIYGNSAGCGGGAIAFNTGYISPPGFDVLIANNTIVDNIDSGPGGYSECIDISQLYPSPDAYGSARFTAVFVNNIVSGSTTYPAINCGWFDTPNEWEQPIFDHNILYNKDAAFFGSFCIDVSGKYENITAAPQFIDPANGNYQLKAGSPGIDAGNNSVLQSINQLTNSPLSTDLAGKARQQDALGKGYPIIDIGAYEYSGVVETDPTSIVLVSSAYFGSAGYGYTLTANVASGLGTPTGPITFFLDGKSIGTSNISTSGIATLSDFVMTPGTHSLYAAYPGQGVFTAATSVIIIVRIDPYTSAVTIDSTPNPSFVGQAVKVTITALGSDKSPLSPVTLSDLSTNTTLATLQPDSSGVATYSTSTLTAGSHTLYANFPGNATYAAAGASLNQQVITGYATSTTLTCNPATINIGATSLLSAMVTSTNGTPTGSITFTDGTTNLITAPLTNGAAADTYTGTSAGTHNLIATYVPTGSFAAGSATCSVTVNGLPNTNTLTVSPTSGTTATTYTLTATLKSASSASAATPTGTVVFYISPVTGEPGLQIGSATLANGAATITSSTLPVSSGYVYELYSGDTLYANSKSNAVNLNITGSPTTTTTLAITAAGTPVTTVPPGTVVTLTATTLAGTSPVSPGQVNFCDAAAPACTDIHLIGTAQLTSAGTAVLRFIPGPGTHSYKAVFVGTQTNSTSASPAQPLTVGSASSNATTTLLSATGAPGDYTLTATVTGSLHTTPTGTISFLDTGNDNYVLASAALSSPGSGLHFTELPINPTGDLPSNVVTADFNGDGILDFAVAAFNSLGISVPGSLSIFLGKGDGTFSAGPVLVTDVSPQTLVVADFNADGKADLAYSTLDSGNITVLLGNGDGSFTQAPNPIQGTFADVYGLVAGDFNGDGNEDLVYDDAQTRKVVVLLGNGDGTFAQVGAQSATGDNPIFIVAGDFNRDGKLDLAVDNVSPADGSLTASNLTILLGKGDGTFTSAPSVPVGVGPEGLVTADFNGDGKLDLAVANIQPPATVMVFSGNGDGTFSGPVSTIPIAYLNALSVGDVNGDGIPDIATSEEVGSTAPQNATILVGKGDGSFTIAYAGDGSITPVGVTAADFNGDGLADLAVPAEYGGVEVFLSTLGSSATATVTHISPVGTGQHLVDASFPGDSTYAGSLSNPVSLTAQRVPTTLTLVAAAAPSGSPITLTAAISPDTAQNHLAGGSVTFTSNGVSLSAVPGSVANGLATLTVASLPDGLNNLSAQYSGDSNFAPSSGTGSITVGQSTPDFTFTGPSTLTFRTQSTGSATLTLTSLNSFIGPVALTCNLPQPTTYTCALSPATPSLAANGTAASTLTLHPVLSAATSPANPSRIFLATLCPLALLLFARRRRHSLAPLLTLALLAILTSALTACGSDVYTVATRPGTYPLTVTATGTASGTPTPTTHTLALNVVITP